MQGLWYARSVNEALALVVDYLALCILVLHTNVSSVAGDSGKESEETSGDRLRSFLLLSNQPKV